MYRMKFSTSYLSVLFGLSSLLVLQAGCASVGRTDGSRGANVSGGSAVVCIFCFPPPSTPRAETLEAKKTMLTEVENTEYREIVAEVIHTLEPHAYISIAGSVLGLDGARTVDILVWPVSGSVSGPIVIDVIDRPDGQSVGIDAIDAADSKRRDIRAKAMLLCSNTGFDVLAVQKAKRANIGLISVLKQGDQRIKGKIEEEIYLRKVNMSPVTLDYEGATTGDYETLRQYMTATHNVTYEGKSVANWLQQRAVMIIVANPKVEQLLIARFELKRPTEFLVQGNLVTLRALSIRFQPRVQWLSQIVVLRHIYCRIIGLY